jgi:arabinose-5-phosphate isomerase
MVVARKEIHGCMVESLMTANPRTLQPDLPLYEALNVMETHQITVMPVIEADTLVGTVHLHDILGKGAVKFRPASGVQAVDI